jgi:hypothetical protein
MRKGSATPQDPLTEEYTRHRLMKYAELIGAQEDLKQVFAKWDALIPLAPPNERVPMAHMAILEIERLLDVYSAQGDGLTVNGKIVIPAAKKELVPCDVRLDKKEGA